ncbi:MAG: M64 family metallopeptidase [Planctomycetota bacterium]|jgi:hypothetical protein
MSVVSWGRLGGWLLLLLLTVGTVGAQDQAPPVDAEDAAVDPEPIADPEGTEAYEKAVKRQQKKAWVAARNSFRKFIKKYPNHPRVPDAQARSGDNAYLGTDLIFPGGPSERRIDVAVMGDGFTLADQGKQEKWAKLCIKVLFNEDGFDEYRNYFNIWFVRLASFEEKVDPPMTPEQVAKRRAKNKAQGRPPNYKIDYNTALDCKAAGPQGQVMADRNKVYTWLGIADRDVPGVGDDKFVIAFARFGRLGMGGGGVANVGRPDKSITVHEFGHSFSRLLDEYTNNPGSPQGAWGRTLRAANAHVSPEKPKPEEVPWAHMLKKRIKGVGIYEGGATFYKGVWRPAASCAMNVGGVQFCPVCREASILVIYEYVSPIDEHSPQQGRLVKAEEGDATELSVTPMRPKKKKLKVYWYVQPEVGRKATTPGGDPTGENGGGNLDGPDDDDTFDELEELYGRPRGLGLGRSSPFRGVRRTRNRAHYADPPPGELSKLGKVAKGKAKAPRRHVFPVGELEPGRYRITVEVRDETKWVIKDDFHLLKERATWRVIVAPKMQPAAPPAPPKK